MKVVVVAAWVVVLGVLGACVKPPPPAPPRQTNLALKISSHQLANGLRVVLVSDPRAAEVQVTMRYGVGSADERAAQAGIAHLVEHLMFAQTVGAQSVLARLEDVTTYYNASTSFDATTYVARAHPAHLEALLSIEAVRLGLRCTSITESAFVREREVVINELRQHDLPTELYAELLRGVYPADHPYARAIGGTAASVAAITRDQACAFADAHYAPANAVLVVSGNVAAPRLETALTRYFTRIRPRAIAPRPAIAGLVPAGQRAHAVPLETEAVMVAWPLPADPYLRATVEAVAAATYSVVDGSVRGRVVMKHLGDDRAPALALIVQLTDEDERDAVIANVMRAVDAVPVAFRSLETAIDTIEFNGIRQGAIHGLFATLEEGSDRDTHLAAHVLAGRDPSRALASEVDALRALSRRDAARIAEAYLTSAGARIVVLTPTEGAVRRDEIELAATVHDRGQRRDRGDLAAAERPIADAPAPHRTDGMATRTLPNGLDVVLLPLSSVPTVDVRLIFDAGTADEPRDKRGAALVAAHGIQWRLEHVNDILLFAAAGGAGSVDVDTDHTAFGARGLDMHLDYLLAGVRRWIVDGRYGGSSALVVDTLRQVAKETRDEGALTDAWRAALFGADHPYVQAGLPRHVAAALGVDDAAQFRAAHYTPSNATLVIAGRFDVALADRWIDHLFADWKGPAAPRVAPPVTSRPVAFAEDRASTQVEVELALPATAGSRAQQLVAAAMLAEIAEDVRHQLGASYDLTARLVESRLARRYVIRGAVDAARATEALALLRTRLAALAADTEGTARAFIGARRRVLTRLAALTGSATRLADRVQRDVTLARAPLSDITAAREVQALTLGQMPATLAELELTRALVRLRGPAAELDRAFAALDRTPTRLPAAAPRTEVAAVTPTAVPEEDDVSLADLTEPLTLQGPPRLALAIMPGYSMGRVRERGVAGATFATEVGYRLNAGTSIGVHASIGRLSGSYEAPIATLEIREIAVVPLGIGGFIQALAHDRLWGGVFMGLQLDRVTDHDAPPRWHESLGVGIEGGIDLVQGLGHRLAAFGRIDGQLMSDASFAAFTLGVAYRR